MYIFAKFHRIIFAVLIAIILCLFVVAVKAEDHVLKHNPCVHKEVQCHCYYIVVEGEYYLAVENGGRIIAIYGVVKGVVVLLWEDGVEI